MKSTKIKNASKYVLFITLDSTECKKESYGEPVKIESGETYIYNTSNSFDGGCAKMTVGMLELENSTGAAPMIIKWSGIIPLASSLINLDVTEGKVKVTTDDGEIPECKQLVKSSNVERSPDPIRRTNLLKKILHMPWYWWIFLFITLCLGGYIIKDLSIFSSKHVKKSRGK